MNAILAFIVSVLDFFRHLWTSAVALVIFQEKPIAPSQDIESGIHASIVPFAEDKDIARGTSSDARYLAPSSGGFVDVDLKGIKANKYDHPIRRPSRRASAVDPLKSRIVDATLKQVQDKTINFVKTVTLTPSTIFAHPYTAVIEYYEPHNDNYRDRCRLGERKPKGNPRAVQFVLPPIIVEGTSTSSISTVSDDDQIYKPSRRHTESSIADLFDQFPLPPSYIPPTPPAAVAIRQVTQTLRNFSAIRIYPSPMVEEEFVDNSETESITSTCSSGSDSDATTDTSAPGSPPSNSGTILPSNHTPAQAISYDNNGLSSSVDIPYRSSQFSNQEKPLLTTEISPIFIHPLPVDDALASKSFYLPDQILVTIGLDAAVFPVQTIEEHVHHVPKDSAHPALNLKGYIECSHNVVDGFIQADLQKGDIFDEAPSKNKNSTPIAQVGLQDILKTSPSEDAIVDDLLAGLENSLEFDEQHTEATLCSETTECLLANMSSKVAKSDFEQSVVAPLRIVKKNQIQSPAEEEHDDFTRAETSWEDSLEKVLQAFKDAEAEDSDFRDLFYRDSSFLSQSSLVNSVLGLPRYSNISSGFGGRHEERLKRLDESFESVERSVEELLAELELLPDTITIKTEDQPILGSLFTDVAIIEGIMDDVVKPGPELVRFITSIPEDDEEESYTWTGALQDEEHEDAKSSEGEDNQWSDLLGLDAYAD